MELLSSFREPCLRKFQTQLHLPFPRQTPQTGSLDTFNRADRGSINTRLHVKTQLKIIALAGFLVRSGFRAVGISSYRLVDGPSI